jgi:hypothetical protein
MARLNVLRFRQDFKKDKTKETEQKNQQPSDSANHAHRHHEERRIKNACLKDVWFSLKPNLL